MNPDRKRWLVTGVKIVLALVILFFVGWQFQGDLAKLDLNWSTIVAGEPGQNDLTLRPGWLLASGAIYLLGIFNGAWFWRHLLTLFGYPISLYAAIRAQYVGQLGKYVPGKAMAVAIRAELVHPDGVPYGVSIIASFYEVFTGMAAGAIVAAIIYMIDPPGELGLGWHPLAIGAALIGLCGIPLLPGVFNFVIARLTAKIQAIELYRLPPVGFGTLAAGLATASVGWCLQGLGVWALLQAVLPQPPEFTLAACARVSS
jgi:hypothetical protein